MTRLLASEPGSIYARGDEEKKPDKNKTRKGVSVGKDSESRGLPDEPVVKALILHAESEKASEKRKTIAKSKLREKNTTKRDVLVDLFAHIRQCRLDLLHQLLLTSNRAHNQTSARTSSSSSSFLLFFFLLLFFSFLQKQRLACTPSFLDSYPRGPRAA